MRNDYFLHPPGIVCALGCGVEAIAPRLFRGDTDGIVRQSGWLPDREIGVAAVSSPLPPVSDALQAFSCRTSGMLLAALAQIAPALAAASGRYGPARIGVVLGTSTSGVDEGERAILAARDSGVLPADYHYVRQELGMPARFLARAAGISGPAYCISTACTSSAKAFLSARNLLRGDVCDAVVVGGVDVLCKLTLNGFSALDSVSAARCNPLSRNRDGITIGEGAALFVMSREPSAVAFLGGGESSDAYHVSAPHPDGAGAETAMRLALSDAGIAASQVGYLNLHATATPKNDEMESRAVARVFSPALPVSGTKPMTGHALGAAGALELAVCWIALERDRLPPHVWDGEADDSLPALNLVPPGRRFDRSRGERRVCLSNSFAFGGSNVSLVIGEAD